MITPTDLKKITTENWHDIDKSTRAWFAFRFLNEDKSMWLEWFSCPKLDAKVPTEVTALLEVTRGAMIYGWYFYPLLTLGVEQCYRLLDTGTRIRCKQLGIPTASFKKNMEALMKHGAIPEADGIRWDAVRKLRNSSSHPERQSIYDPGQAQETLALVVDLLNDLFR